MPTTIRACAHDALKDGEMLAVEGAPSPLGVCRVAGQWYAFENDCTHESFALTEGALDGAQIECPLHGAKFCVRTGAARAVPATRGIGVYPVRIEQGDVLVDLP